MQFFPAERPSRGIRSIMRMIMRIIIIVVVVNINNGNLSAGYVKQHTKSLAVL